MRVELAACAVILGFESCLQIFVARFAWRRGEQD
jgi:hypothetical protein